MTTPLDIGKFTLIGTRSFSWTTRQACRWFRAIRSVGLFFGLLIVAMSEHGDVGVAQDATAPLKRRRPNVLPVVVEKPVWRDDLPFGTLIRNDSGGPTLKHRTVGVFDFILGPAWELETVSPDHPDAVHAIDGNRIISKDEKLTPDMITPGMIATGGLKDHGQCWVRIWMKRIPAGVKFDEFIKADQAEARQRTISKYGATTWDPYVGQRQVWLACREGLVVDVDGFYRLGGLRESYYYLPVVPEELYDAMELGLVDRYVYVLHFTFRAMSMRDTLTLTCPSMTWMMPPVLWNGVLYSDQATYGDKVQSLIDNATANVGVGLIEANRAEAVTRDFIFEEVGKYALMGTRSSGISIKSNFAAAGQAWNDYLEYARAATARCRQRHLAIGQQIYRSMNAEDHKQMEKFRPGLAARLKAIAEHSSSN